MINKLDSSNSKGVSGIENVIRIMLAWGHVDLENLLFDLLTHDGMKLAMILMMLVKIMIVPLMKRILITIIMMAMEIIQD